MTLIYHPFVMLSASSEANPKDLAKEEEILRFTQHDSKAVNLAWSFESFDFAQSLP